MIANYISELLKTSDRVIIPNFGAFLKSKGEVQSIIFNEFVKFNDGLLIKFISEKESVEIEEASKRLDVFVESVKEDLDKGKKVEVNDLGYLFKDERGRTRFKGEEEEEAEKPEAVKEEIKEEPPKKEKKMPEPVVVPKPANAEKPKVKEEKKEEKPAPDPELKKAEKPVPPPPKSKLNKAEKPVPPPPKPEPKKEVKPAPSPPKPQPPKEKIVQDDPRKVAPADEKPEEKKEKKKFPVIWLILAIVVVAIAAWAILDWNNIPGYFSGEKQTEVSKTEMQEPVKEEPDVVKGTGDEVKEPPVEEGTPVTEQEVNEPVEKEPVKAEEEIVEEPKAEIKPEQTIPAKKYHLIAGCFKDETNADKLVAKLKSEGFFAEKVAKVGSLYYVSYNSYEKKADALYELQRLTDQGYSTWVYFY